MTTPRRTTAIGLTVGGCLLLALAPFVAGQVFQVQPGQPVVDPAPGGGREERQGQFSAIKLNEDTQFRRYLDVAEDCIKDAVILKDDRDKLYKDAVTALQLVLDSKTDYSRKVKTVDAQGRPVVKYASVKTEANRLLGSMPPEGLAVYEIEYGAQANQLLQQAKDSGDTDKLAEVAYRFFHTSAGPVAADLLATYSLDRGKFLKAALQFERLLSLTEDDEKISDLTLFKAALAYRRYGDMKKADQIWERLAPRARRNGGIKIGEQLVATDELQNLLAANTRVRQVDPHDFLLVRGNLTNSAQADGSPPLLDEVVWKRPLIKDFNEIIGQREQWGDEAETYVNNSVKQMRDLKSVPVMPGFFPIAADGKLIYRTYSGITSVYLHETKDEFGDVIPAGGLCWKTTAFEGSLARCLNNLQYRNDLNGWLQQFERLQGFKNIGYENSMVGTLSSDGQRVYAVDDLAVPVPPTLIPQLLQFNQNQLSQQLRKLVMANNMQCFELRTGRILWRLGPDDLKEKRKEVFENSHFLGPPLNIGGKLYALNEENSGELRLVTLDPETGDLAMPMQPLGTVDQNARVVYDPNRRVHAVHLAYDQGILVCPTNAGLVLGIDLLSRTLAWAYPYRESEADPGNVNPGVPFPQPGNPIPLTVATWKVAPPVIQDGKVVVTAPDAESLHCISLRDGGLLWKLRKRDSDLFLAGVWNGTVVVVGKNSCFGYGLDDGRYLWSVVTGALPSGQGVASENIYYLPLENGEVCAVDVARGAIKAHNRAADAKAPPPGNLVFYEGSVLSQTPTEVMAYPQLVAKLNVVKKSLEKDPANLELLTQVGEMELANGQVHRAVQDLLAVTAKGPGEPLLSRARGRLYEAMTDLFQQDFATASKDYMKQYEELCKVPGDPTAEQQRLAQRLRLLGRGWEGQGDLVAAFQAYREFGALPLYQKEGVPALDDPARRIPTQVWLRGRISSMFDGATPAQKEPLSRVIVREWEQVKSGREVNEIRSFVAMFDVPFPVGREARLQLADAIIDKNDRGSFLEAELSLQQLRGRQFRAEPAAGGKALEALARLAIKRSDAQSMRQAAAYYRELAREFPDTEIRAGKTGSDFLNDLATDKRFLPYLSPVQNRWPEGKLAWQVLPGGSMPVDQSFVFQPRGGVTAATTSLRVLLDPRNNNNPELKLVDTQTNKELWTHRLDSVPTNFPYFQYLYQQAQRNTDFQKDARFRYFHVQGHLGVVQVGAMVYAIDLENPRVLWERPLVEPNLQNQQINPYQVVPDGDGNLILNVRNNLTNQNQRIRIGHVAAVQPSYVCLVKHDTLEVLDPLTGKVLWSQPNISPQTDAFGDERSIYLVDVNGGTANGGRALRVADGTPVTDVPDFSAHFQNRRHVLPGGRIVAATPLPNKVVLRLYDITSGTDVWSLEFPPGSTVLETDDPKLAGVIEPDGQLTVADADTGKVLTKTSVLQYRVTAADLKDLREPLLLADAEHFYVALNHPVDNQQAAGGVVLSNFYNGIDCRVVNGWFCAFHREAGARKYGDVADEWKAGDMHWHSYKPIANQMVILEQFDRLPVLLFSARYIQPFAGGGNRAYSMTQSINKENGKMVYSPVTPRPSNGAAPQFNCFTVDMQKGTINMIGFQEVLQHYIEDPRAAGREDARAPAAPGVDAGRSVDVPVPQPAVLPPGLRRN